MPRPAGAMVLSDVFVPTRTTLRPDLGGLNSVIERKKVSRTRWFGREWDFSGADQANLTVCMRAV
jgi:hypothetical protein